MGMVSRLRFKKAGNDPARADEHIILSMTVAVAEIDSSNFLKFSHGPAQPG